jgi:DNA-binding ferritin-like protein (Dps family)
MKKYFIYFLIFISIISCRTPIETHTTYQREIRKKQNETIKDVKLLVVKTSHIISSGSTNTKQIGTLLEAIKDLLDTNDNDGKDIKNLDGKELDDFVDDILKEDDKRKEDINELKQKDDNIVAELVASNIKLEALEKDQSKRDKKFYLICVIILGIITLIFYFVPSGIFSNLTKVIPKK